MELDTLKAIWKKSNKSEPFLRAEDIRQMLRNENNGALNKLIRWEKFSIRMIMFVVPFFLLSTLLSSQFTINKNVIILNSLFIAYIIPSFFSQRYKIKYLKEIDMMSMDIVTVSERITKYRRYILNELIIGFIWAIPLIFLIVYLQLGTKASVGHYIFFAIYSIVLLIIAVIIHNRFYFKRINVIQRNIEEIKDFELEE